MLFIIYEGNEHEFEIYLEQANIGDYIEYVTNNQMGYKKYIVALDDEFKKYLRVIDSYELWMG
jgi:hypothetical protein